MLEMAFLLLSWRWRKENVIEYIKFLDLPDDSPMMKRAKAGLGVGGGLGSTSAVVRWASVVVVASSSIVERIPSGNVCL